MSNESSNAPAGWYPDDLGTQRYWDGQQWTLASQSPGHPAQLTPQQWYRKWWVIAIGAVIALFVIIAIFADPPEDDTNDEPVVEEVEPTVEPEPEPEPTIEPEPEPEPERNAGPNLGNDPYLNGLVDECARGDADACDSLFWESPIGSDYETWALEQQLDVEFDDDIATLALWITWEAMPQDERDALCESVDFFGVEWAADLAAEGAEGSFSIEAIVGFLQDACSA